MNMPKPPILLRQDLQNHCEYWVVELKHIQPEPHDTRPGLRRAGDFCL